MNIEKLAADIVKARKTGVQTHMDWPNPAPTMEDAMLIQASVFKQFGSPSMGWKIGATNKPTQNMFNIKAPFFAPMADIGLMKSGDDLKKIDAVGGCEPEYGFKLAQDYPAKGEEINVETATAAIEDVYLVIEIIGRCIGNTDYANGIGIAMDFGGNTAFVVGPKLVNWQEQDLANAKVESIVDGDVVATGNGHSAMDDPVNSVVWLAKQLVAQGKQIKAGEWVSTGTCTTPVPAKVGTTYTAKFGAFGEVSINFI